MTTLYLTEPHSLVKATGDTLEVHIPEDKQRQAGKRKIDVPLVKVDQVVVYGDVTLSGQAMIALLEQGTDISFFSDSGQFRGRLDSPLSKNGQIRLEQHRIHQDPTRSLSLARTFVIGKINNMRATLVRANRNRDEPAITQTTTRLKGIQDRIESLSPDEEAGLARPRPETVYSKLRGLENAGTALYWKAFAHLLQDDWKFARRRHPTEDPVNVLLALGDRLLVNQVSSTINTIGLDPYVGFLHSPPDNKPALALDIMQPFRPLIVDAAALALLNTGALTRDDFIEKWGVWHLTGKGHQVFLTQFEEQLDSEIRHPIFSYQVTYRRSLELEVRCVAKWFTGETSRFRPFMLK